MESDNNEREEVAQTNLHLETETAYSEKLNGEYILPDCTQDEYYTKAQDYWSKVSPTIDGMLGGFANISLVDVRGSTVFLQNIYKMKPCPEKLFALDCGAGIGRVSKNLLMPFFKKVDMVEQDKNFCDKALEFMRDEPNLGEIFNCGLQTFVPEAGKYDVIWSQWVLGHLKDHHLVEFFKRCGSGLKKNGVLVVKENFTSEDEVQIDTQDSSVTRPMGVMKKLFEEAGLRLLKNPERQTSMPKGLYPVYMVVLRPNRIVAD